MKASNGPRWSAVAVLLAALSLALAARPLNSPPETIRLVTLLGRPLPVAVAEMHGTFARYGVAVHFENMPNSDQLRATLKDGNADIAYAAVDNAVAMVELAGADVVIVMGGEGSQNELMVQPDIKSIKDLRGKTLIVDAPNTAYALQMKKVLALNGLQAAKDYEIKPVGTTPQRLVAMREHPEYAGSMLGPPTSLLAKKSGFVSLGTVPEIIGPYQAAGYFAQRKWAQEHSHAVAGYLAAIIEAQRWLMDPINKPQVIELMIKESHLAPEVAAESYEFAMARPGGYEKDAQLDLNGFTNVLKLRAEVEGQWGGHPPAVEKYYDASYYTAAISKLKGTE
ncbi:MAG: ABC transporter substrate-binding protein [Candidatus Acidiferrum sp.]|jgi:ABC-type nitrate/sulfonate/bicarbonate transport system substrate-binding protein